MARLALAPAEAKDTLDLRRLVLDGLDLSLCDRHRRQQLDELVHRFRELVDRFGQGADGCRQAFDDLDVMAGNGTIGLEILEDLPDVDAIVVPWGGGGLTCGIASVVRLDIFGRIGANRRLVRRLSGRMGDATETKCRNGGEQHV